MMLLWSSFQTIIEDKHTGNYSEQARKHEAVPAVKQCKAYHTGGKMKELNRELPDLYLVVPCYNEEEIILESAAIMKNKISDLISQCVIGKNSRIMFVNDGSKDNTFNLLSDAARKDPVYILFSLVGNTGH